MCVRVCLFVFDFFFLTVIFYTKKATFGEAQLPGRQSADRAPDQPPLWRTQSPLQGGCNEVDVLMRARMLQLLTHSGRGCSF